MNLQCFAVLLLATTCYGQSVQNAPTVLTDSEQYMEASALINIAHKTVLNNILNPTNLTNYQTHYAIIVKVLQDLITNLVNTTETYDDSYNAVVSKAIVSAMDDPTSVVKQYVKQFEIANTKVLKGFEKVTDDICPDIVEPSICNVLIDNMYIKLMKYLNPWTVIQLKHLRHLFLTLRDTASLVLGYDRTFKTVSEDHSAVKYVVEGKEDLRPLVKNLRDLVKLFTVRLSIEKEFYKRI